MYPFVLAIYFDPHFRGLAVRRFHCSEEAARLRRLAVPEDDRVAIHASWAATEA
jgi:hypothetical protein